MIAADRRRMTPVLGAACALLALACIALWAGAGKGVRWDDDASPPPLPPARAAVAAPEVPSLQTYAVVWERPLFSPDRRPIPGAGGSGASADSGDFELTGVIIEPGLHMALLRQKSTGRTLRVREGAAAGNGPLVVEVKPRSVVIDAGGSRSELPLKAGPAPAPGAGVDNAQPAATASDDGGEVVQQNDAPSPNAGMQDSSDAGASAQARLRALKARIEQRRRQAEKRRAEIQQNADGGQ